jgi:protein involved in polysaccharide export with SLBB domain
MKSVLSRLLAVAVFVFAGGLSSTNGALAQDWMTSLGTPPEKPDASLQKIVGSVTSPSTYARQYTLGPDDVLSIQVFNAPELTQEKIKIRPDGKLDCALLDEPLQVTGKTVEEARRTLLTAYARYYKAPQLTLSLVESKPFTISILGAVLHPGGYEFMTQSGNRMAQNNAGGGIPGAPPPQRTSPLLSNVLVAAGGISYDADISNIQIENAARNETMSVDLHKLLLGEAGSSDVYLIPGDRVHVPRLPAATRINENSFRLYAASSFSPRTIPVRVLGYVNRPGLVNLDAAQSRNLLSAIAEAGGFDSRAAYFPRRVYLYRSARRHDQDKAQGRLTRPVPVDPNRDDIALLPNDVIYVPQKAVPRVGLLFDFVERAVRPLFFAAQTYRSATGAYIFP